MLKVQITNNEGKCTEQTGDCVFYVVLKGNEAYAGCAGEATGKQSTQAIAALITTIVKAGIDDLEPARAIDFAKWFMRTLNEAVTRSLAYNLMMEII